ncbi:IclR family transcriptional regulator [Phaeobacter sp. HF9A]|uniref:IclR family transcriptional regulator n=1 Tax=Phaeobacter sp. HF9A TaxID=2721561 RepID=UPI00142FA36F|nr:IclR family transcriptional regulator [Phaeobacter sp. HF9A]NIZ13159.1 IclR family transcriptional regulator [Phaeobacter sp. HF9A]
MSSTVTKALSLLEFFSEDEPELGLSDLARRSGMDKAAVHRMLGSMAESGLVEQQADSRLYRLGAGVLRLARVRETAFPVSAMMQPILLRLSTETGETAHASLISGRALANIATCESKKGSRVSLVAGEVLPYHSTASGLAALAYADDKLLDRVLSAPREARTRFTLTERDDILTRIEVVRANGFSESDQAHEEDVHGLAAPLFDRSGRACGAVSVSTPSHRMTAEQRQLSIAAVLRAAEDITAGLGGQRPRGYADQVAGLLASGPRD